MNFKWILTVCLALLVSGGPARALTMSGLYGAELEVSAAGQRPTPEQIRSGLAQVLVKLSGRRDIASRQGYGQVMEQAPVLLSQYRFRPGPEGTRLELVFDQLQLDRLMHEAGIQGPGLQRPALLLWLAVADGGRIDYAAPGHPALVALEREARLRGVPLQLPLLDLDDQISLPPEQLWNLPESDVRAASQRYRPDAILLGRTAAEGGVWHSRFRLLSDAADSSFEPAGALEAQMTAVVDEVADRLLLGGAPRQSFSYRPRGMVLQVEGVDGESAYLQLISLLRRTEGVTTVFPERFSHGELKLRLQLETSVARLQETLKLDARLEEVPAAGTVSADETGLLQYRWRGQTP